MIIGGESSEHEISLKSGLSISAHLNRDLYSVRFFFISREGKWYEFSSYPDGDLTKGVPLGGDFTPLIECDLLFPVLHGPLGEDGTIQGLFEILGKPYIGCDHRASSICMDKTLTKKLCQQSGVRVSPYRSFTVDEWKERSEALTKEVVQNLNFPLFLKCNHLGSAIGVYKVLNIDELQRDVKRAFTLDYSVVVEEEIQGREIEFAVLGNEYITAFPPGEVLANGEVYSYEAKYGKKGFSTSTQAELPQEIIEKGKSLALQCYKILGCQGLCRIDFFLDEENEFCLNEMNPIPGFTEISLYPAICRANGLLFEHLVDRLVTLSLHKYRTRRKKDA